VAVNGADADLESQQTTMSRRAVSGLKAVSGHNAAWILLALLILVAFFSAATPNNAFFDLQNFKNIALDTSPGLIMAVGATFVICTAGIDLSVGSVLVFSGVVASWIMLHVSASAEELVRLEFPQQNIGIPLGIVAGLLAGILWGALNGVLVARFRVPSFIVTLGTSGMAFGFAALITGGVNLQAVPRPYTDFMASSVVGIQVPIVIALVIFLISYVMLHHTAFGVAVLAIGSNERGASRAGVPVLRYQVIVYTYAGLLYGVAGLVSLGRFTSINISAHLTDNLSAITAVVIGGNSLFGGIGSMIGTGVGAFMPSVLENGFIIQGVNPFWQDVALGGIIIVAVWVDQWRRQRRAGA